MNELVEHIELLKKQFQQLNPLKPEDQQRLDKKLRLEWNYNSNHIEGNTLTYGETELLLVFGETKGNHEFREYDEMKGHDIALKLVQELASDKERQLNENFIREINKVLLKEPFYKEAITAEGQPTRKLIKIGEYKSLPNSVRLQNGEIFHYASPQETPALMNDLLQWYQQASLDSSKHPIEIAAELHYRFVRIHPFDDGNGRISRLLMNFHLIKNGYPPVIIKSADKKNYLFALHEADTGNMEAFYNYVTEQLLWSYEISIKAAKGENIDEPGDWEKKITLLQKSLNPNNLIEKRKTTQSIHQIIIEGINPIVDFLLNDFRPVTNLFFSHYINIKIINNGIHLKPKSSLSIKPMIEKIESAKLIKLNEIEFDYYLDAFKHNGIDAFTLIYQFKYELKNFSYQISIRNKNNFLPIERFYHQIMNKNDLEIFANNLTEIIIEDIKQKQTPPK